MVSEPARSAIGTAIQRIAFGVARLISPRTRIHGIQVWLLGDPPEPEKHLEALRAGLDYLAEADPRRFKLAGRFLRGIGIAEHGGAAYLPTLRICVLGINNLRRGRQAVASDIVHELTHARLFARGFRYTAVTRSREERICATEALRFLDRSPEGHAFAAAYREALLAEFSRTNPWYSENRREQAARQVMDAYNVPQWLQRLRRRFPG